MVPASQESCRWLEGQGGRDGGVFVSRVLCIRARALGLQKGETNVQTSHCQAGLSSERPCGHPCPVPAVLGAVPHPLAGPGTAPPPPRPRGPRPPLRPWLGTRLLPKGCRGEAPEPGREHRPPSSGPWWVRFGRDAEGLRMIKHLHALCVGAPKLAL